jgi:PPOX class probable F420-dependent enzyme
LKLSDLPFEAIGGQPAFTPNDLEQFVAAPRIGVLGYVRKNGTANQVPIWYAYEDGCFKMTTTTNSPKAKALARDGRASLMIQDETPPYRAVIVEGRVKIGPTPVKGGTSSSLAVRYFGLLGGREYERMTAEEYEKAGLVELTLVPERVRCFDNNRLIGAPLRLFMRIRNVLPIPRSWL